jgi:hypothetical protein
MKRNAVRRPASHSRGKGAKGKGHRGAELLSTHMLHLPYFSLAHLRTLSLSHTHTHTHMHTLTGSSSEG